MSRACADLLPADPATSRAAHSVRFAIASKHLQIRQRHVPLPHVGKISPEQEPPPLDTLESDGGVGGDVGFSHPHQHD